MGFLNEQSLRMIVEAPRDESRSFIFTEIPHLDMSMPLNQSGPLRKMIMAAFFYVTASVGWPELQIIRRASNGTSYIAFTTNTIEPKPTRYLNLYEYDLAETRFYVRPGDVLNLSWQGDADWTRFRFGDIDRVRFNLAYYRNGTSPEIPMVSIVVGDCDSETDQLTLNLLNYCENVTEPTTSGITSTQSSNTILSTNNQNDSKSELTTVVVIGVVTSCALLLMTMIIIMIIMVLAMHWHKSTVKKSSTEENDSKVQYTSAGEDNIIYNSIIEVDVNEAYTIPTGPNVAYSTLAVYDTKPHDYDYIM